MTAMVTPDLPWTCGSLGARYPVVESPGHPHGPLPVAADVAVLAAPVVAGAADVADAAVVDVVLLELLLHATANSTQAALTAAAPPLVIRMLHSPGLVC
jgi:hypothetical protein